MKALGLILRSKLFFAPALIFLSLNLCVGTWAIGIPQIKSKIGFSESALGLALLCFGFGTFLMLLAAPNIINRIGLGKTCFYAVFSIGLCFVFPFVVDTYLNLCIALFILGISTGLTDIGMNTLVSQIEQNHHINIMSANHGFFSLGGVISAGIGAWCLALFSVIPFWYVIVLAVVVIGLNLYFMPFYFKIDLDYKESSSFKWNYVQPLLVLLVVGFICMAAEGAVADWSALYIKNVAQAAPIWFALGFLSFSVFMTLGRFLGDSLSKHLGSYKVLYLGLVVSIFGYGFVLFKTTIWSILGFGLVGLGLSVVIPELFRISGQYKNLEKSRAISLVAGSGYIGFLIGPVLFGFIADMTDLWWSFVVVLGFIIIALSLVFFSRKPKH